MQILKILHFYILVSVPLTLITGPFLPDLSIVLSAIFFLFFTIYYKNFKYYKNIFFIFFILWCLYLIIRSLFSDNILLSLESSLFHFRFGLFFLSIWYALDNYKNFIKYSFTFLLIGFLIIIFDGYYQYFNGYNILGYKYDGFRLSGLFGNEKILGSYLSRLTPLLFAFLAYLNFNNKFTFFIIIFTLTSVDILVFLSGERSAFFYILMSTLIIIFLVKRWKYVRIFTFFLALFAISIITYNSEHVKSRMIDQTVKQFNIQNSDNKINTFSPQHEALYLTSYFIFKDNIIFGIGPKMFREKCATAIDLENLRSYYIDQEVDLRTIQKCSTHTHNTYIQLLVETGITGSIPVILLSLLIMYKLVKHFYFVIFKRIYIYSDYRICLYAAVVISLWPFIPTGNFFNNWLNVIYFLPVGFILYDNHRSLK